MVGSLIGPTFFRGGSRTKFQHQLWSDDPLPKVLRYAALVTWGTSQLHEPMLTIGWDHDSSQLVSTSTHVQVLSQNRDAKVIRGEHHLSFLYVIILVLATVLTIEPKKLSIQLITQTNLMMTHVFFWCPYLATSFAIYISLTYRCPIQKFEAHIRYNDVVG